MGNKLCRFLSLMIVLVLLLGFGISIYADVIKDEGVTLWNTIRTNDDLFATEKGIKIKCEYKYLSKAGYDDVVKMLDFCNEQVSLGLLKVDSKNNEFYTDIVIDEEILQEARSRVKRVLKDVGKQGIGTKGEVPDLSWHDGCTLQTVSLIYICDTNYSSIINYMNNARIANNYNPNIDYTAMGIGYWVYRVRSGGEWDYKVSSTYGPYNNTLCWTHDQTPEHITAEYMGNFNYGYTGSIFFSLSTLHLGSFTVSGFSTADFNDWPAIDRGYYW